VRNVYLCVKCVAHCTSDDSLEADEPAIIMEGQDSHPTGIVLHRVGYYTIPSLDELICHMSDDGSCVVDNFTVGREGYGNVFFPDSFDVADLNLDEIGKCSNKYINPLKSKVHLNSV
jgi:nuclear pore complex protein Nup98-Nup96